jgi:membrane peptidoglycan carboxypeptidase
MVGGGDYSQSRFNRAVQAKRQPGSAFKLFVYLAALRNGFALDDRIDGGPVEINGWKPENFGDRQYGRVTLADAFANSINTATVNLALKVGLDEVVSAARELGIDAPMKTVPSLALGAKEVSLLDLTAAYAGILAGRAPVEPWGVAAFGPQTQKRLMSVSPPIKSTKPLGEIRSSLIELLQLPVERGTARNASLEGFAAGKTGTSQNHRDAWYLGFNDSLVVGVWVGNDDGRPMANVTGGSLPAKMWKALITKPVVATATKDQQMAGRPALLPKPTDSDRNDLSRTEQAPEEGLPGTLGAQSPDSQYEITRAPPTSAEPVPEEDTAQVQCDIRACARAYRSFDPKDCTYQPYGGGPRVKCDKGVPRAQKTSSEAPGVVARQSPEQCNVAVCARTYNSFRASDCTYQPYGGGPRRICDK